VAHFGQECRCRKLGRAFSAKAKRPRNPRKPRKPILARAAKEAAKAGLKVTGATYEPDGRLSLQFGDAAREATVTPLEQWRARRHG
jgi:hypothetical protein